MRKAMFIAGFAVGFVAGARSGRGTYDKLVGYGRQVAEHPKVQEASNKAQAKAPARSLVSIDDVGVATAFLAHDAARLITGETLYIDGGYHIID